MADALLLVRACGPHVTYQDGGRFGMMRFGVPASGGMDRLAHATAHAALGRAHGDTAIEVSAGGLELTCESGDVTFGIAGGEFHVERTGVPIAPWCVRTLRAGDVLAIRPGRWGSWTYLAFAGDIATRRWAGSASTHSTSGLGGGRLATGDHIVVRNAAVCADREGDLPIPSFARPRHHVRVVLGPQTSQFAADATESLLHARFAVSTAYDRMGMRLLGPPLTLKDALSIPSEPVVRGAIQVGGDGVAAILLADHGTTGGYPKIATVISSDLDAVAQLQPHEPLHFHAVSPAEAVARARTHAHARQEYLAHVATARVTLADRLMQESLISGVVSTHSLDTR